MLVHYGGGEKPRYEALRHAIDEFYQDLLRPLLKLRAAVFGVLPLRDPRHKDAGIEDDYRQAGFRSVYYDGDSLVFAKKAPIVTVDAQGRTRLVKDAEEEKEGVSFTEAQLALVDQAVEIFLNEMAGEDRTREGFIAAGTDVDAANGIIQSRNLFSYSLGISRGAELVDSSPTLHVAGRSPAVEKMLDNAFERLSEKGSLRLEGIRDELHSILTSAQAAGISPIETGRQLAGQFDEYSGYEFQRLARTEAAFASEAGVRDQMWDLGVKKAEWLISADACPICEDLAAGGPYDIDDEDNLPPAHPNCLCSCSPVSADSEEGDEKQGGEGGDEEEDNETPTG